MLKAELRQKSKDLNLLYTSQITNYQEANKLINIEVFGKSVDGIRDTATVVQLRKLIKVLKEKING